MGAKIGNLPIIDNKEVRVLTVLGYLFFELVYGYGIWYFLNPFISEAALLLVLFVYGLFVIAPILGRMMMLPTKGADFNTWCVVNLLIVCYAITMVAIYSAGIFPSFLVLSLMIYGMRVALLSKLAY